MFGFLWQVLSVWFDVLFYLFLCKASRKELELLHGPSDSLEEIDATVTGVSAVPWAADGSGQQAGVDDETVPATAEEIQMNFARTRQPDDNERKCSSPVKPVEPVDPIEPVEPVEPGEGDLFGSDEEAQSTEAEGDSSEDETPATVDPYTSTDIPDTSLEDSRACAHVRQH